MPMISSLRSWFGLARKPERPGSTHRELHLEVLEDRAVPAIIPAVRASAPINTGHFNGNQAETAIAVDPTNPRRLFTSANNSATTPGQYGSYSIDGGTTWNPRQVATGADIPAGGGDPTLSWDNFGNLFYAYLSAGTGSVITLSTDGGQTFRLLTTVPLAVDQPTITTGAGTVWMNFLHNNGQQAAVGARVTGLGQVTAFSAPQLVPGSAAGNFGDIAIGQNGQVSIVYQDSAAPANGPSTISVSTDPDGLGPAAFGAPVVVLVGNVGPIFGIPAQPGPFNVGGRTIDAETGLVYDRSNGPFRGRLYLVYVDRPTLGATDFDTNIFLRFSTNNGATWSTPRRVNDDILAPGSQFLAFGNTVPTPSGFTNRSQFMSKIALDQTTGDVAISWYDCRFDAGNGGLYDRDGIPNTDVLTFSTLVRNGGRNIFRNVQVATRPSNSVTLNNNGFFNFGDYMGLTFDRGRIYPVWVDNSVTLPQNTDLPTFDIATARISLLPPVARIFYPMRYIQESGATRLRGNLTLTNIGEGLFANNILLVFSNLPRGVTLANATGFIGGQPFLRVNVGVLGKNTPFRIPVIFNNPLRLPVSTFFVGFTVQVIP